MSKPEKDYPNTITFSISDAYMHLMDQARQGKAAQKGFGSTPNETEFIQGVIYYWIRKNAPELLNSNVNIPEILKHKALKEKK